MRSKAVVTRHRADEDVDRAFEYYLKEGGPDVAIAFVDEYERSTSHLSRAPLSGSLRFEHALGIEDLRQWPLRKYPYLIIYVVTEHSIEVWRVLHSERDIPAIMHGEDRETPLKDAKG